MNKANIMLPLSGSFLEYPDNKSYSVSVYFCGCWGLCDGCHNYELQDAHNKNGTIVDVDCFIDMLCYELKKANTRKVVMLGGDPLYPTNMEFVKELVGKVHDHFDFCIYTGQDKEYVVSHDVKFFKFIKCGRYVESLKQLSEKKDDYLQLASSNQCLYDSNLELLSNDGKYYFK